MKYIWSLITVVIVAMIGRKTVLKDEILDFVENFLYQGLLPWVADAGSFGCASVYFMLCTVR